ncbi:MAG: hypothetical protein OEW37_07895 [Rhodospirillaceae bacterium]|nr:hypothetical protein [Rhodospirillaceae bacterium]
MKKDLNMNAKLLAIIAIVLWAGSAAFVGFKFISGTTLTATDGRAAIVLEHAERDFILTEMRGFLVAVQEVISAANKNDMDSIKKTSHRVGMAEVAGVAPETMLKLPMAFKQLGMSTHEGFDEIGLAAEIGPDAVLDALDANLSKCIACHESYRLTTADQK